MRTIREHALYDCLDRMAAQEPRLTHRQASCGRPIDRLLDAYWGKDYDDSLTASLWWADDPVRYAQELVQICQSAVTRAYEVQS